MKNPINILFALILIFSITSCGVEPGKLVPEEYITGQTKFHKSCANCHGPDAMGGNRAPNLIQKKFAPSNYSNESFTGIIINGSRSGAMPSQKGRVSGKEIGEIIKYIRYVQQEAGLT